MVGETDIGSFKRLGLRGGEVVYISVFINDHSISFDTGHYLVSQFSNFEICRRK